MQSNDRGLMLGRSLSVRPVTRACDFLTAYDFAEIAAWAETARRSGITRVEVRDGFLPDVVSNLNYVAIHEDGQELPSYGLARRADGYHLWRIPDGEEKGIFSNLAEALRRVMPIADTSRA